MYAIITVGLNHSGKSYFANKLASYSNQYFVFENDAFRSLIRNNQGLNTLYLESKKNETFENPDLLISYLKHTILYSKVYHYIPIISNCNGIKGHRINLINWLKSCGYKVIVIYCNPGLPIIQERLNTVKLEKDKILFTKGVEENLERMLSFFDVPNSDEGDYFWEINNDESLNRVIKNINELIML